MKSVKLMLLGITLITFAVYCCVAENHSNDGWSVIALIIALVGLIISLKNFSRKD